jgi:hypothetical protein
MKLKLSLPCTFVSVVFVTLTILFSSCNPDEDPSTSVSPPPCRIDSMNLFFGDWRYGAIVTYKADSSTIDHIRITDLDKFQLQQPDARVMYGYTYTPTGKVNSIFTSNSSYRYTYNSKDKLIERKYYRSGNVIIDELYKYDSEGRVSRVIIEDNLGFRYYHYTYSKKSRNPSVFYDSVSSGTSLYLRTKIEFNKYDNHPVPGLHIGYLVHPEAPRFFNYMANAVNNPVVITKTVYTPAGLAKIHTIKYEYQYNAEGLPTYARIDDSFPGGGFTNQAVFQYRCE